MKLRHLLTSGAGATLLGTTACLSAPAQQYEIIEHQYAFNAPFWSPFSSSTPHPLVIWHGLGDSGFSDGMIELKTTLEQAYPGLYVHLVALGENAASDRNRGVFGKVDDDVDQVCSDLSGVKELKDGFDAIGFSQGGQFLRALVQRCDAVQVRNLVTFGSQHMGISDLPACSSADLLCRVAEGALRGGIYTDYAQSHIVSAQYFRDPRSKEKLDHYLQANHFLTDINNELTLNEQYRERLSALQTFVMLQFEDDVTVVPKRSGWFEAYPTESENKTMAAGKKEETIPLRQSELYTTDRLGLRRLDKRGALVLDTCKGRHMEINAACQLKVFGKYVATPKSSVPRWMTDKWDRALYLTTRLHPSALPWTLHLAFLMIVGTVVQILAAAIAARLPKTWLRKETRIRLP